MKFVSCLLEFANKFLKFYVNQFLYTTIITNILNVNEPWHSLLFIINFFFLLLTKFKKKKNYEVTPLWKFISKSPIFHSNSKQVPFDLY